MKISDNRKIEELQKEFSKTYPNLSIKFYKRAHKVSQGSKPAEEWSEGLTIGEIRSKKEAVDFQIKGEMTIGELESKMAENMGLNVQVFRASTNNVWLQSTTTDDWTLLKANK